MIRGVRVAREPLTLRRRGPGQEGFREEVSRELACGDPARKGHRLEGCGRSCPESGGLWPDWGSWWEVGALEHGEGSGFRPVSDDFVGGTGFPVVPEPVTSAL